METETNEGMLLRLRREASEASQQEPILSPLLSSVGLLPGPSVASSFEEAISRIVAHRLSSAGATIVCPSLLQQLLEEAFASPERELGHTMSDAVREDAIAVLRRDPACDTLLEVVLFTKGFLSLVIHRAAWRAWKPQKSEPAMRKDASPVRGKRFVALMLQSLSSSALGVDIHPAAQIGASVMIDHATGVVIGETATVGDGTTILHGVTLGGTGKESGDRHPKVGKDVLIGAGTNILGNIKVGDRAKIGAGSVVLRAIPTGATAVGVPAKIIGFTPKGERPGSTLDISLFGIEPLSLKIDSFVEDDGNTMDVTDNRMEEKDNMVELVSLEESVDTQVDYPLPIKDIEEDNIEGTDDDDDNLTDFGNPAKLHWVNDSGENDDMCPFRNAFCKMTAMTDSCREDLFTHKILRSLLIQEGCTEGETVEVFFELLHLVPASSKARQCGCIPIHIFAKYFEEIAREKTTLDPETCRALAKGDLKTLGLSKKASKRFRSIFSKLRDLPSSTSVSSPERNPKENGFSKYDRKEMESFLDTTVYQEGISI